MYIVKTTENKRKAKTIHAFCPIFNPSFCAGFCVVIFVLVDEESIQLVNRTQLESKLK